MWWCREAIATPTHLIFTTRPITSVQLEVQHVELEPVALTLGNNNVVTMFECYWYTVAVHLGSQVCCQFFSQPLVPGGRHHTAPLLL